MFWHCDCINSFWIQLERWINEKCQHVLNFSLSESLIIFGTTNNVCTDFVFDMIILLAKQYIYSCKYKQNLPNLEIFKKRLKWRYNIEKYNAKINNSFEKFVSKWALYTPLVD